ncbi:hypothetical protein IW140_002286 [Coemansia sp. RSA 1813]|nr:hypothetical protein EV178_001795 [Coemansia sp. RSA 1646]KAJ1770891.1 hypothetical protein LPJ74_002787 [Coemansia sp. RSA 1843]KAJ2092892.1 hypothetical protein IW138_000605 [Coemansia sp. RSA 986]KAJ2216213.1 hypothetical protein EV179_001451 [Coemansia sp. RSA 487]KAJ2570614.1 hypothetical protein IW140_002286 [Coemansia sp. RSA 1813]
MSSHVPLPKERHSKSKLFATISSLSSKKKEHTKYIETHPFNHRLSVIVSKDNKEDIQKLMAAHIDEYYKVSLKLTDLIDPAFIQGFIRNKSLVALSLGMRVDTDDVFAIDGNGQLIMSLCKDTYQVLGLAGTQSQFPLERGARFVVTVDLLATCMDPEKKYFRRLHSRLDAVFGAQEFEFAIGLYDRDTGKALSLDMPGATVCKPQIKTMTLLDVNVPDLAATNVFAQDTVAREPLDAWNEQAQDIFEWIGLTAAGAGAVTRVGQSTASAICTYSAPVSAERFQDIVVLSAEGMLSPKAISLVAQKMAEKQGPTNLLFLCVWGYEDAPVSWGSSEHGYLTSGENMYAQAYLLQADKCATFQACGPWDTYS